jgi:hypothetical protein
MRKKLVTLMGTTALITLLGLFVLGGTAFAQSPTPPAPATPQTPWGYAWGRMWGGATVVSDAVTKLLGMTEEQIYTERAAGKTLADIAKDKGITDQQLLDAMQSGQTATIAQAVKDGVLTQAQADWMLERMKTMAPFMLDNPFTPGGFGGGPMMHGGMRGGFNRWGTAPAPTPSPSSAVPAPALSSLSL